MLHKSPFERSVLDIPNVKKRGTGKGNASIVMRDRFRDIDSWSAQSGAGEDKVHRLLRWMATFSAEAFSLELSLACASSIVLPLFLELVDGH
jgi:hypothetical protein